MKFFSGLGRFIEKSKIFIIVFWAAAAVVIILTAPVLSQEAKTDATSFFQSDTGTMKAAALYKELYPNSGGRGSFILVLSDSNGITQADRDYGKDLENYLNGKKDSFDIQDITSPFTNSDYETAMISPDGKAALILVGLKTASYVETTNEAVMAIRSDIKSSSAPKQPDGLTINITGDAPIAQEYISNIQKSLSVTTIMTIILVVVVLLLIYRSPLAPVIPLSTISISFVIARGIIAMLAKSGYPVSSFTEIFLIAVLFGAGTDYCLLLISRYREELVRGLMPAEALSAAFPHTSLAIVCSGGTVIIGFLGMIAAKFGLYSSTGPSIAIGVGITMLAVLTLTPSLISLFGEAIFWPAHPSRNREKEQQGSRFWNRLAALVTQKPIVFMVASLVVFIPFIVMTFNINRSFDTLKELPQGSDTVIGFNVLSGHFNEGEMLPVKVVLKTDKDVWSNTTLQAVDNVAQDILKVDNVAKVRTATRPSGDQINELTLPNQISKITGGLTDADKAFDDLSGGISDAKDGVDKISDGINGGVSGLNDLSDGTKDASSGISKVYSGLKTISGSESDAINGVNSINSGMNTMNSGLDSTKAGLSGMKTALQGVLSYLNALGAANPAVKNSDYYTAYGTLNGVISNITTMSDGIDTIKGGVTLTQQSLTATASGLTQIKAGIDDSRSALSQIKSGLSTIRSGQNDAADQLKEAVSSLDEVSKGLQTGIDGVNTMKNSLSDAQNEADDWAAGLNGLNSVFYLPDGTFDKYPELKKYMQEYISDDGHGVIFNVILTQPPYSAAALDTISKIQNAVSFSIKNSALEGSEFYISGSTGAYSELRDITQQDFIIVIIFVLLGIFIVLVLLLKSLVAPLYLIITIVVSYLTTLGISYLVFQVGLGYSGLSWSVPFFSFCLLVALGVDYNIFLMTRVKEEYRPGAMTEGTSRALATTGKIITSCGIIMAGTFGAMLFSPIRMLVQIGFTTVVGLLLDTFIVRCMLVPSIAVKVGELNWWPGRKMRIVPVERKEDPGHNTSTSI